MVRDRNCLIVGGGVIGLSLAYDLVCHGWSVRVVDQGRLGREASWAGAGMLPPANPATAMHPLTQLQALSQQLHPVWADRLVRETGIDTGYRTCGAVYVARTVGETASLVGFVENLREEGVRVDVLSADALSATEPNLSPEKGRIRFACLLPDESQLRNPWHLKALATACRQRGVVLDEDCPAIGFAIGDDRLEGLRTERGVITADHVCLASGAWTFGLLKKLGVSTGILPVRGQMLLLKSKTNVLRRIINEGPRYLVPRQDGRLLVGSTEEEVGFDKSNTDEAIEQLHRLAVDLAPLLADAELERSWAGLRPGSFDGFPYLGRVPGLSNAFVAAGHFRSGLNLSPGTATVMGRLIRGEDPQLDLSPFHVGRG